MRQPTPSILPLFDWKSVVESPTLAAQLRVSLELPLPIANLLVARGYADLGKIERLLSPITQKLIEPFAIPSVQMAATRLLQTIKAGGEIVVFGDFDVDGVVATALLTDLIRFLGGKARPFLPDRHTEGYGLTPAAMTRCLAQGTPALFITVDCGMGATELLADLHAQGIQLLITDHHTLAGAFPDGCIVINPHLPDTPEGARHLCGAGVAFQLANGVIKLRGNQRAERLRLYSWLEAVAIATIADVVPLLGDNRTLVAFGLQALNKKPRVGLSELMKKSGISNTDINSYHLGFILGPRLNAAGRMETAVPAFQLLLTEDQDEARELAIHLDTANTMRKITEHELLLKADEQLVQWFDCTRHGAIVVGGVEWHAGTVGIVASRLMNQHHRPAAVVALDAEGGGHGSVRAGKAYNAVQALAACASYLERLGGHARAAGFTLKQGAFEAFRTAFAEACFAQVGAAACQPELTIDGWLDGVDIDQKLIAGIRRLEPFGESHPLPCWGLRQATLSNPPRSMGADGQHLRLNLVTSDGLPLQAVWFRGGPYLDVLTAHQKPFDIVGEIQENDYGGDTTIQLVVRDVRLKSGGSLEALAKRSAARVAPRPPVFDNSAVLRP